MVVREMVRDIAGEDVDTNAFAAVIDISTPIDFVVVADVSRAGPVPEPMIGFSIGLRSLSEARAAAKGRPQKLGDGVWRLGPDKDWGDGCAIVASSGGSPGRLVCTESFRDLSKLAPYMARNLPTLAAQPSDLHLEVRFRNLFDKYGRQWTSQLRGLPILADQFKLGIPKFDEAVLEAATALGKEAEALMKDADSIVLDAKLDNSAGGKLAIAARFTGTRSWLVDMLTADAAKAGPAPGIFWRAPANSSSASFGRTGDPARWEPLLETGRALLEGMLEQEKMGTGADRAALAKLLRSTLPKDKATVFARGAFDGSSASSGGGALAESFGWMLWGVDDAAPDVKAWIREAVNLYNRPTVQSAARKELHVEAADLPKMKTIPAPAGLGPGALAVELTITNLDDLMDGRPMRSGGGKPNKDPVKGYLLTMSEGGRSWVALGADKDKLVKLLGDVKAGTDTLTKRAGLERLKRESHVAATITTAEGLIASAKPGLWFSVMKPMGGGPDPFEEMTRVIKQMPNRGQSPIFMFYDATAGAQPHVDFTVEVPAGTLRDLGSLANKYLTPRGP
jgi:hypothetical protein